MEKKQYFVIDSNIDGLTIVKKNSSFKRFNYFETFCDAKSHLIEQLQYFIEFKRENLKEVKKLKETNIKTKKRQ